MTDLILQLSRIFEGLLGCNLEFHFKSELSQDIWNIEELDAFCREQIPLPSYVAALTPGLYGFPVAAQGQLAGLFTVNNWKGQDGQKLFQLGELLVLILEKAMDDQDRFELIRALEERIQLQKENKNVIFLSKARDMLNTLEIFNARVELPMASAAPLANSPLMIHLESEIPAERVAIDIHELTGRWAFMHLNDLPTDILQDKKELDTLGSVTIFIRDLSTLTSEQQQNLATYLTLPPSIHTPHFVAMVPSEPQRLIDVGMLSQDLCSRFAYSRIQWAKDESKKVVRQTLEQILERTQTPASELVESSVNPTAEGKFIPLHPKYFENDPPTLH